METGLTLTSDMMLVLSVLGVTIALFVFEVVRVDVVALAIMILLGLLGLVPSDQLFSGFASNAVISIIAVMILGAGLDRTGVMTVVAAFILRIGGKTANRIVPLVSGTVGAISSLMQNVGATALFLPVVSRISVRTEIPLSRLLMPMGFCAIMGGTMTMVGSSPLIMLNDLIVTSNASLPPGAETMVQFELFDVAPVGLALLATGILYFLTVGKFLLPDNKAEHSGAPALTKTYFADTYGIEGDVYELLVTVDSPLVGMQVGDAEKLQGIPRLLAIRNTDEPRMAPPSDEMIWVGTILGVMGTRDVVGQFALDYHCRLQPRVKTFGGLFNPTRAGISEVVIPPGSKMIGQSVGSARLRKRYGISVLAINRRGEIINEDVREQVLEPGDCLVSHSTWRDLSEVNRDRKFIVATDIPKEEQRPHKVGYALLFFALSIGMIIFTDFRLSIALFAGALGMILTNVITIDDAYNSVSWKTVPGGQPDTNWSGDGTDRHSRVDCPTSDGATRKYARHSSPDRHCGAGNSFQPGDVKCWCHHHPGANRDQYRNCHRRQPNHVRTHRRTVHIQRVYPAHPPGQRTDYWPRRLPRGRLCTGRQRYDSTFPDRDADDG